MINLLFALFFAYLLGSIPFGFIFGKILKKIDIRDHGSGNIGATNVIRVLGTVPGTVVLILDMLKGVLAVTLLYKLFYLEQLPVSMTLFRTLLAVAVISGHNWTVFLNFKGGKGVATSAGAMLALSPQIVGLSIVVWILTFLLTRIVSLGSMISAISLPVFILIFDEPLPLLFLSVVGCLLIFYTHRANIRRLIEGEEKKIQ